MSDPVFRRIALTASILALMTGVAALATLFFKWMEIPGVFIPIVAASIFWVISPLKVVGRNSR